MKKRSKLRKGLAILLSLAMVVGLVPGVGTMKVSAEESSATEETGTAAGITYTPLAGDPKGFSGEEYSNLLDGTADTKWCCSFTNPSYVIFKTSEPVYVNGYSIWTANDTGSESGRNPVAWTLSGCNDYDETNKTGGNWVTIHEVKGDNDEEALPAADKTEQSYSFAESEYSYQYFKLNITAIKDGSTMQLGDFSLTYNACEHQWVATGETIEPTCTEGGYEVYQCSLCQATKKEANSNPATGHRWEITETVAPTCTEEGYTHQECSACKEEQNIEIKSALGHELNENGVCTRCGISVPYLSCNSDGKNWTTSTCPSAFLVKADDTKWGTSDTESWYVASGTVTIDSRVTVNGTVHLILADNCNLTINGGIGVTQGNNFTIYAQSDGNEMGHLTIQNVSVKDAGIGGTSSISGKITINGGIVSSATQATDNSGAAIGGGRAYYGDVTINGGKVTASGYLGAGIGHGSQASGGSGGVVINGGKVTASSYIGAGIGGGYGGNAKVTIKGGVITATSKEKYGIGSGSSNPNSTVTITDSPVIFASSISDQSGKENNTWSGIIFEGNTGKVYGTSATVDEDCTIPGGKILEVAKEQTISIADNKTLTNEGIIYNNGTFTGAVTNSGTIHNTGTISGELGGTVYHYTVEPAENSNCQSVGLALKAADTAFEGTVTYALADSVTNVVIENESTLKVTNRDEIKDTIPVTATFTVNNVTMTKTGNISIPDHNFPAEFDDGFKLCSVCGKVIYQSAEVISDTHYPELIGNYVGYYAIENAGQLYWFAGLVNGTLDGVTQNKAENAVLTADIDLSGIDNWTPIGNETNQYTGTFDGQNHTIKDMSITEQGNNSGLFGYTANAAIKNIIISGKITITAASYTEGYGSIVGRMDNSTIFNCHSSVNITIDSTMESTEGNCIGHIGGIVGKMHEANSAIANCSYSGTIELNDSPVNVAAGIAGYAINSAVPITNCSFTGTINSTYSGQTIIGGIFGYTRSAGDVKVTNCLSVGTITKSGDTSLTGILIGQINNGYGNNAVKNNYYSSSSSLNVFGSTSGTPTTAPATSCTTEKLESGEVAFLLQGEQQEAVWGQKLGENGDTYPVLKKERDEGNTVYQNETYASCEGNPGEPTYSYSNTEKDPVYADHTDGDKDGKCDTCSKYMDNIGARLVGHSLTLDGSVGVNFYMELSSEVISDSSAYMEFTLPGGKTSTVKVSEAPTEVISGTTYYKFKCQVNATAMTDTITAQIKSTVGNSKVYEYTVKEYADYLFEHKNENTEFAKAAELIEAMVNYGSYAQIYAGYNTEKLAVGDAKNLKSLDDVWITAYYEPSIYETKVQFAGANLSLLSTTTLRMYFQLIDVEANEVRFGYQGQLLEMKQSGDYYYVELVGIPASKLDDKFRIDVLEGSTNFVVTYTPMAYCTSVVTRPTTETRTESLKNLIKALVMYNQAADAYISED